MLAEIFGPELLIVLAVILVLFGGSQLPKLARGLGSAQREFKKGLEGGADGKPRATPDAKADCLRLRPATGAGSRRRQITRQPEGVTASRLFSPLALGPVVA